MRCFNLVIHLQLIITTLFFTAIAYSSATTGDGARRSSQTQPPLLFGSSKHPSLPLHQKYSHNLKLQPKLEASSHSNNHNYKMDLSNTKSFISFERSSTPTTEGSDSSSVSSSGSHAHNSLSSWQSTEIVEPHTGHKKVLVTGGAGFIGSHVADFLLERGDDVVIVDEINDYYDTHIKEANLKLLRSKYGSDRLSIFHGDICDEDLMSSIFEQERPDFVCHMAARAGVRPSIQDPYVYIHSNIEGTTRLMELSAKYGVKNFVFASSSSVYGGSKSTFFSEDEVVDNPVSPYAASKKACELLAYTYHHLYNLNVSALRFFTVYGPRGRPDMAPFKFIDRISRGVEIQQFGDGSSSRDYTYISDIVDGVVRAIDRPYAYQIFNLGKGSGTSLKEFIGLVEKHTGQKANIKVLPDQAGRRSVHLCRREQGSASAGLRIPSVLRRGHSKNSGMVQGSVRQRRQARDQVLPGDPSQRFGASG